MVFGRYRSRIVLEFRATQVVGSYRGPATEIICSVGGLQHDQVG